MNISTNEIRSAIATRIAELTGFQASRYPPEFFGRNPAPLSHLLYSVGIPSTTSAGGRQKPGESVQLNSRANVKFAYRLKPTNAYPDSYDLALAKERELILKLVNAYTTIKSGLEVQFVNSSRTFENSFEYMIIDIQLYTFAFVLVVNFR